VQLIPSTLWLGLASNPSARACDHVQRWSRPLALNYQYTYKSAQVWHGGAWTKLLRRAGKGVSASMASSNVRFWGVKQTCPNVRYSPESRHRRARWGCPICAKSGHFAPVVIRSPRQRVGG
jgi:hypothetical protein